MEENIFKVGDLCKHFKGENLSQKNIYKIIAVNVTYSGDKSQEPLNNLVVYENIFQSGKTFVREYKDLVEELSKEKQNKYNQKYRVEKLTKEEIELINTDKFKKEKLESKQSFTEPPPRYTEASLVKTLEEKGIGRPSTYSPTITTILARRYIEKIQKQLHPTELGKIVNKLLVENFPDVLNVKFTAEMEEEFDKIAEGKEEWKKVIQEFYGPFKTTVEKVEKELEHVKLEYEVSDVPCEKCGRMMVIKYGKYGKFLACPGYPECKNAKPLIETIDEPCPKCGGKVQIRKTKKRRNYYICENNPTSCDYISWNKPGTEEKKTVKKKTARKAVKKKTTKKKSK